MQRKTSNTEQRLDALTDMVENPLCDLDSEHSDKGRNANLEANPVNSGANSRLGDNSQEQEILELPSYGPVETELTSFSSEISELLSFKEDLSPLKPKEAELLREPLKLMGCSHMPSDEHQNQVEALQSDIPSVDSKPEKLEVIHKSLKPMVFEIKSDEKSEWVDALTDSIEIGKTDSKMNSIEFLVNFNAYKVFVKISKPSVHQLEPNEINLVEESQSIIDMVVDKHRLWNRNMNFDPGIAYMSLAIGSLSVFVLGSIRDETCINVLLSKDYHNWVCDPGGAFPLLASGPTLMSSGVEPTIEAEVVD